MGRFREFMGPGTGGEIGAAALSRWLRDQMGDEGPSRQTVSRWTDEDPRDRTEPDLLSVYLMATRAGVTMAQFCGFERVNQPAATDQASGEVAVAQRDKAESDQIVKRDAELRAELEREVEEMLERQDRERAAALANDARTANQKRRRGGTRR